MITFILSLSPRCLRKAYIYLEKNFLFSQWEKKIIAIVNEEMAEAKPLNRYTQQLKEMFENISYLEKIMKDERDPFSF